MNILDLYYQRRALNAMVTGSWETAQHYFIKLLKRNPGSFGQNYNLGVVFLAQKKFQEAETILLKSVKNFGKSLQYCRILGDLYYHWGRKQEALQWYGDAVKENPSEKEKKLLLLRLKIINDDTRFPGIPENDRKIENARLLMKTNPAQALHLYVEASETDPTDVEALNNIGSLYMNELGQPEKAAEYFKRVLTLVDNHAVQDNLKKTGIPDCIK